jgi:hypothetical protein
MTGLLEEMPAEGELRVVAAVVASALISEAEVSEAVSRIGEVTSMMEFQENLFVFNT